MYLRIKNGAFDCIFFNLCIFVLKRVAFVLALNVATSLEICVETDDKARGCTYVVMCVAYTRAVVLTNHVENLGGR